MNRRTLFKTRQSRLKQLTLSEWITEWYNTYKKPMHAITTQTVQLAYINSHIIPILGHLSLKSITASDVQKFLNNLKNKNKLKNSNLRGKPLAPWTKKKIRALLLSCFNDAIKHGIIYTNPVLATEPISLINTQASYFTKEQQKQFLDYTKNHRFHLAYKLLFYTGCRRSEILGLSWNDIDLKKSVIHINQVVVNINGTAILKNYPKTKTSIRTIPLPKTITKELKHYKKNQIIESKSCSEWNNKYNLVFTNKNGSIYSPNYFLHNFKQVIKKLNLPKKLRVHSTRHTFATNLLQMGVSLSDVQALGGWSDTSVLLDIYAHTVKASQRKAIEQLFKKQ